MNLINKADLLAIVDVSTNIEEPFLLKSITIAEDIDLTEFLGAELIHDFKTNILVSKYVKLLNGDVYTPDGYSSTIEFKGIKPALAHLSYARYVLRSSIKSTMAGLVIKSTSHSDVITSDMLNLIATENRSIARVYLDEATRYLNSKISNYPFWKNTSFCENTNKNKINSFISTTR